jgi:hypothetical protein
MVGNFGMGKLWSFYKIIFIGQNFENTSISISYVTILVSLLRQPSRIKAYTPLFLISRGLGNPSRWITCLGFRPPEKAILPFYGDESLFYVQKNYNMALHRSISHNPFQVGLRFQPLGPIDVALPLATTQEKYSHVQCEAYKATRFIEWINTSANRSMRFVKNPMLSKRSIKINNG